MCTAAQVCNYCSTNCPLHQTSQNIVGWRQCVTNLCSAIVFPPHPYLLTFITAPLAPVSWSVLFFVARLDQYATRVSHWDVSTPIGHVVCPCIIHRVFSRDRSDFMNRLTQSLNPWSLNSWWSYSNSVSITLRNSAMSITFCSPTFIIAMLRWRGAKPRILSSHIFLPTHAPSIFPFFVTSTWWGGKPFWRRSAISIFRVLFKDRYCALITACEGERGSSTPTPCICGMPPFVAMPAAWCLANPCALVSQTPFPPPLVGCIDPPQCKFPCPAQFWVAWYWCTYLDNNFPSVLTNLVVGLCYKLSLMCFFAFTNPTYMSVGTIQKTATKVGKSYQFQISKDLPE